MRFVNKNIYFLIIFFIVSLILTFLLLGAENFSIKGYLYSENYDLISDQLAFKFFINDQWHFPIGKNPNYGIEVGNSIVFSGAVPILSFLFKSIARFLPNNFQFITIWFVICFTLQLFFSYLIINHFTRKKLYSFISSFFFIICPVLLYRIPIHITLVAHWIILFCLYYEITNTNYIKKETFYSLIFPLSILIHFYFLPMLMIIKYSFLLKDYIDQKDLKKNFREIVIPLVPLVIVAYISGYFQISAFDAMGFGYGFYSFNLAGFIDPQSTNDSINWSMFFTDIKNTNGQAEGFSYLGIGGIILFIFFLIIFFKGKETVQFSKLPFIFIFLICFLLSISNNIYLGNNMIFEYQLPKLIYGLLSIIRASGRFIWILYYLIIIFGIISIFQLFNNKNKSIFMISFILIIQAIDISPALKNYYKANAFNKIEIKNTNEEFWKTISEDFKIIRTTYFKNSSNIYPYISNQILENDFLRTDISRLGRYDRSKASSNRNRLYFDLNNKQLDKNTAYVIDNINHLRYLKYLYLMENMGFFFVDGVWLMLSGYKNKMSQNDIDKFDQIKIVEIKENTKHNFMTSGLMEPLGLGWTFSSENKGIWTEGNEFNILFKFKPKINKTYKIKLKISSIISKPNEYLNGFVKINGQTNRNFKFKNLSKGFIEFSIPNIKDETYKVDIIIKNPTSPLDLLQSPDGRMLGLLIESLEII